MSTLPAAVAPDVAAEVEPTAGHERVCIYCPCRPHIGLCGTYINTPNLEHIDGTECRDCTALLGGPCPSCGCGKVAECGPCKAIT
jgi:hypothetical protein